MNKYFLEIQNRFIFVGINWLLMFFISYFYKENILYFVLTPCFGSCCLTTANYFIFTGITELFSIYLTLICAISTSASAILFFFHIFRFLVPALYFFEHKIVSYIFFTSFLLFHFSSIFFVRVLFPSFLTFFLSLQANRLNNQVQVLQFEAKIDEYVDFFLSTYTTCVLSFQFIFIIGLVFFCYFKNNLSALRYFRKIIYLIFLILATVLTPPDAFSQLTVFAFFLAVFEVLVFLNIYQTVFLIRQPVKTD